MPEGIMLLLMYAPRVGHQPCALHGMGFETLETATQAEIGGGDDLRIICLSTSPA
jgi:hypothetical protein